MSGNTYNQLARTLSTLPGAGQCRPDDTARACRTQGCDATGVNLSHQARDQVSSILSTLKQIGSGAAVLQTAENSLALVSDILKQMKHLAECLLSDGISDTQQIQWTERLNDLCDHYRQVARTAVFDDKPLFKETHRFDIVTDQTQSLNWTGYQMPEIDSKTLASPEATLQAIDAALSHTAISRTEIRSLLTALLNHASGLYRSLEAVLSVRTPLNTRSAAIRSAYRTATQVLQTEHAARSAHAEEITHIAARLFV